MAFSRFTGAGADLFSVALDGSGGEVQLDRPSAGYASAAGRLQVSPDGVWAVYYDDEIVEDVFELFARRMDGSGSPIQLNGPMTAGGDVSWDVSSGSHAISSGSHRVVYRADQDTAGVIELYSSPLP